MESRILRDAWQVVLNKLEEQGESDGGQVGSQNEGKMNKEEKWTE